MRLRTRFLCVLAVFTVIMLVAAVISARIVLAKAAMDADEIRARILLDRGTAVLDAEVAVLATTVNDWASWDDSYAFMAGENPDYRDINLVKETLDTLRVEAVIYYATNRQVVEATALDSNGQHVDHIPLELRRLIEQPDGILDRAMAAKTLSGFVAQNHHLWMIAAAPILTSQDEGPARGILMMVRNFTDREQAKLSRLIDPSALLVPAASHWPAGRVEIRESGLRALQCGIAIPDILGSGRLILTLTVPRTAYAQVTLSLLYLTGWTLVFGAGLWLLSACLLNRWVLRSVTDSVQALQRGLALATTGGGARPRLAKVHNDEIGDLADAVEAAIGAVETSAREADRRRAEAVHSQRLAALGTLAAGVAHEINNPNGIVALNLNVLHRELERLINRLRSGAANDGLVTARELDDRKKELTDIIQESLSASDRIAGIIAALKSFAQPVSDDEKERVTVSDLIEEAFRWLRHEYHQSQCRIEITMPPDLPPLTGNRPQLLQVFINLLQNACQAEVGPDRRVRISASHDREAGTLVMTVADNGKGMPPESIERAMDPFFTTRRNEGGTGLGLSISAAIVKAHGGRLSIESRDGTGTVVTVILPIAQGEDTHGR